MGKEKTAKKQKATEVEKTVPVEAKKQAGSGSGLVKIAALLVLAAVLAVGSAYAITKIIRSDGNTGKKAEVKEAKKHGERKFFSLDAFTVNLSGGQNYLQIAMAFEIDGKNSQLESELKDIQPQINDSVISILSAKSISDISDNTGREKLKAEIKKSVDSLVSYGKIERVYFMTFIIQ